MLANAQFTYQGAQIYNDKYNYLKIYDVKVTSGQSHE